MCGCVYTYACTHIQNMYIHKYICFFVGMSYIFHLYRHTYTNTSNIHFLALHKTNLHNLPLTHLFCIHIHVIYFNAPEVF